jgi:hypothetical protein
VSLGTDPPDDQHVGPLRRQRRRSGWARGAVWVPAAPQTPRDSTDQAPPARVIFTLIIIDLMLMSFCVVLINLAQESMAATAGTAAVLLAGEIIRRFLLNDSLSMHSSNRRPPRPALPNPRADHNRATAADGGE